MKRIVYVAAAAFIILFSSSVWQEVNPEEAIIGKWEFEKIEFSDPEYLSDPSDEDNTGKADMLNDFFSESYRIFDEDNSFRFEAVDEPGTYKYQGTYSVKPDTNIIKLHIGNSTTSSLEYDLISNDEVIFYKGFSDDGKRVKAIGYFHKVK